MSYYATFVKLRPKDNRPVPVSLPVQLSARSAGDAVSKQEQLRKAGRWPAVADAVRLFRDWIRARPVWPGLRRPPKPASGRSAVGRIMALLLSS